MCHTLYIDLTDLDLEKHTTVVLWELAVKHGARCTQENSHMEHLKCDAFGEVFKDVPMVSTNPT